METDELLRINISMFKKIKDLAEDQKRLLGEDNLDGFLALVNRREQIQREISDNDRRYASLNNSPGKGNDTADEIANVIKSIQEVDEKIEGLILESRERLMSDISKMRKGKNAVNNYGGKSPASPRFIEKKG